MNGLNHKGKEAKLDNRTKVWHDSDDEKIEVNISQASKLKKLRKVENEALLGGEEYSHRLREFHQNRVQNIRSNEWIEKIRREINVKLINKTKSLSSLEGVISESDKKEVGTNVTNKSEIKSGKIYRYIECGKRARGGVTDSQNHGKKSGKKIHSNHSRIDITRLANANIQSPSDCVIKSVEFHNGQMFGSNGLKSSLLSVSGWDKKIKLFSVDGVDNKLLSSLYFDNFPIYESKFTSKTEEMLFLGPDSRIGVYDLLQGKINFIPGISGRRDKRYWNLTVQNVENNSRPYIAFSTSNGCILVLDEITKQLVRSFVMNDSVTGLTFHPEDNNKLISSSNTGEIYVWDINTGRCKERIMDHGSLCISSIESSSCRDRVTGEKKSFILTGSSTGYVNVYQNTTFSYNINSTSRSIIEADVNKSKNLSFFQIPKYTISNLCTSVTSIAIHPNNELAAISSKWSKDSLKLVNLNTGQVFSNWPTARTPLKYVTSLSFSEKGGLLAAGNDKGDVLLYRLNEFT